MLLAQIKAGNNSKKLKIEVTQILYLLYQHNKITTKVQKNLQQFNQVIIITGAHTEYTYIELMTTTEPKTFCFDLPKGADSNLANEIYSIIKHYKLSAEHTIKNKVRQLLSKYKHENDNHQHGKQPNE